MIDVHQSPDGDLGIRVLWETDWGVQPDAVEYEWTSAGNVHVRTASINEIIPVGAPAEFRYRFVWDGLRGPWDNENVPWERPG